LFSAGLGLFIIGFEVCFMVGATQWRWPLSLSLGIIYGLALLAVVFGVRPFFGKMPTWPHSFYDRATGLIIAMIGGCLFLRWSLFWWFFPSIGRLESVKDIVAGLSLTLIALGFVALYLSTDRYKVYYRVSGCALLVAGNYFLLLWMGKYYLSTGLNLMVLSGCFVLAQKLESASIQRLKSLRFGGVGIAGIAVCYLIWAFFVTWLLSNLYGNIVELAHPTQKSAGAFDWLALFLAGSGLGKGSVTETLSLAFNFWALAAAGWILLLRFNPWRWNRWLRVLLAGLAAGMMFGRLFVGWLSWAGSIIPEEGILHFVSYAIAPPVVLFLAGGWALQTALGFVGWSVIAGFGFCVALPVILFNQILQFDNNLNVYKQQKTGLIGYVARFGYWLRGEKMPDVPDDSKGARFTTPEETTALQNPDGAVFGHINGAPLQLHTDKHVLIMASTRSGKGVSLIIPHLLRYAGSAFVLDPKGENARATGRQRAALNETVHYLDPFGISGKPQSRFNPLSRFTLENMEAESKALAAALVIGQRGERDHWTGSAQQLLAAVILHVFTSPDIPPGKKDLPTVRRLLLRDILAKNGVLAKMTQSTVADGLLSSLAYSFIDTPEKEMGSILSTAQRETEILDNPFMIKCLAATGDGQEVDFSDWRKGTMSAFLCLSAPKFPVFNRWLRLVLTAALDEMTDTLNPPALPVCFMLDELATLGHLAAVENAVGLAAGYGIQLVTVFQDVAQMRDLYRGRWASFIGNAGVRALFNLDDYDTAKYWSNFIGGHQVNTMSQQQDIYGITQSQTQGEAFRPLLTPEEIMLQFAANKMLVLPQGSRPVIADRVAYWKDAGLDGLWDDPRLEPAPKRL
jgi:type IV secretion system protein VirD4